MATRRILRRNRVVVPSPAPQPEVPRVPDVRPARPSSGSQASSARRVRQQLAALKKRFTSARSEFYEVGKALVKLNKPAVYQALGASSFRAMVEEHVMPAMTARRLMKVASTYTKKTASAMGVEKAYQLARLAETPAVRRTAEQLWVGDAKLGGRRVREMSAKEIEMMVLAKKKQATPPVTDAMHTRRDHLMEYWEDRLGLEADFSIDAKRELVLIAVPFGEIDALD